jgi:hypothetical protein
MDQNEAREVCLTYSINRETLEHSALQPFNGNLMAQGYVFRGRLEDVELFMFKLRTFLGFFKKTSSEIDQLLLDGSKMETKLCVFFR